MKTRLGILLCSVLGLLVLAFAAYPVQAGDNQTEVSGSCVFADEDPSENGDKFRWWFSGADNNVYHLRDDSLEMTCDFDDERLDGYHLFFVNWDVKLDFTSPVWVVGHDHGYGTVFDESDTAIWEYTYSLHYKPDGTLVQNVIWHGVGPNDGLTAHLALTSTLFDFPILHYEGMIIE